VNKEAQKYLFSTSFGELKVVLVRVKAELRKDPTV
jgi:hypothetical protein